MRGYHNKFRNTRYRSFLINNKQLLRKHELIDLGCDQQHHIKATFDKDPVNGKTFITTNIKSFGDKITTDFYDNKEKEKTPKKDLIVFVYQI